jgi:hypothetical protein
MGLERARWRYDTSSDSEFAIDRFLSVHIVTVDRFNLTFAKITNPLAIDRGAVFVDICH